MRLSHAVLGLGVVLACAASVDVADAKPKKRPAPKDVVKDDAPEFDKETATSVLASIDLVKCRTPNAARGEGHVKVTFTPVGVATAAVVDRGPWLGTPAAKCIAAQFKAARVPAFRGGRITVGKTFRID